MAMAALTQPLYRIPCTICMKIIPIMIPHFSFTCRRQTLQGCADSIKAFGISVSHRWLPISISAVQIRAVIRLNVSFINNSKGKNLDYIWDFGDKTYSTSQNPPPRIYKNSTATGYYLFCDPHRDEPGRMRQQYYPNGAGIFKGNS